MIWRAAILVLAAAQVLMAQTNSYLRDHAVTRGFMLGRPVKATPTPDNKAVLFLRSEARSPKMRLFEFDMETKQTRLLLSPEQLLGGAEENLSAEEKARRERMRVSVGGFTNYELSKDGRLVLLMFSGKLFVLDRETEKARELGVKAGTILDARFSPDGKFVSFVRDHNVYAFELATNRERAVTKGGTAEVSHGLAEFVAQEEMNRFHGYWWSPDSKQIVFQESDAREVEKWFVADPIKPEQAPHASFYPRPGKNNVKVRLALVSAKGGKPKWIEWDRAKHPYLAKVTWDKGAPLTLTVQTRDQKELALLTVDAKSGATKTLLVERDSAWVNLDQSVPKWLEDGSGLLWTTEAHGANRLEIRGLNGELKRVIADKGFRNLVAAEGGTIIHQSTENPTEIHLFANGQRLTREQGVYSATYNKSLFSTRAKSSLRAMPVTSVHNASGALVAELPSVAEEPPFTPTTEIVQLDESLRMFAEITRPRGFEAGKKYPVIVYVYGGPHAQMVTAQMGPHLIRQWLADEGFIVVAMDGRGTPGRGRDWERAIYKRFGSVPLDDQAAGLQALGKRFPEMDLRRVGITGWSFGGYMSALAALRRPDVFTAAVAGAPVVDWLDYDTHYTERYLGLVEDGNDGYREGSLLTYAGELKAALLLMHGTADDNVYFRHTLKLVDALFKNGQKFEVLPLSGLTHMVPDPVVFEKQWTRIAEFFKEKLAE